MCIAGSKSNEEIAQSEACRYISRSGLERQLAMKETDEGGVDARQSSDDEELPPSKIRRRYNLQQKKRVVDMAMSKPECPSSCYILRYSSQHGIPATWCYQFIF